MPRSVSEWVGKTPDSKVPPYVRLRIFRAHNGRCHLSGRKITASDAWDLDHVVALINGGEHRESNLAPALRDKHRVKTAEDVKLKAHGDRAAMRAAGIRQPSRLQGKGFRRAAPQHTATSPIIRKSERTGTT